jgi:hypothetical protein
VTVNGTDIFLGGVFQTVGGLYRNNLFRFNTSTGAIDNTWDPNMVGVPGYTYLHKILCNGSDVFVAGSFPSIGGQNRNGFAKLSSSGTGNADITWNPSIVHSSGNPSVYKMALNGADLFISGYFTSVGGQARNGLAKISTTGAGNVDATWNPNPSPASVSDLAVSGSDIYVIGGFTMIGGISRNGIAKLTTSGAGNANLSWDPNPNSGAYLSKILVSGTDVYVGGNFTSIGGQSKTNLAKLSATAGSADATWSPSFSGNLSDMVINGGDLYLSSYSFMSINIQARGGLAKISANGTGSLDMIWNPNLQNTLNGVMSASSMIVNGSNLYFGGYFGGVGADNSKKNLAAVRAYAKFCVNDESKKNSRFVAYNCLIIIIVSI